MRPSKKTLATVWDRDEGRCAACGKPIRGLRGFDWSQHHRRPAGMGGDPRPQTHLPGNLVLLDGHGTAGCHGDIESRRALWEPRGFLIPKEAVYLPSSVPIEHAVHGRCWLLDNGSVSYVEPQ